MRTTKAISVTLPIEMADMVKAKVESGDYASESEVIREGLRALKERDAAVEAWLKSEAVPTMHRVLEGSERLVPADEVFAGVEERYKRRKSAPAK